MCAQFALTDAARAAWLNMAQLWLQLAQHVERNDQDSDPASFIGGLNPGGESPPTD